MTNIVDTPIYEPVRLIESDDYVTGGIGGTANIAPTQLANRTEFLRQWLTRFTGLIVPFAMTTPPTGWIECSGALISRTAYADLWQFAQGSGNLVSDADWLGQLLQGSFSTGDGSTTFRIPMLRGEFVRGWDNGRGIDIGRVFGQWQPDEFKSHTHLEYAWSAPGIAQVGASGGNFGQRQTGATGGVETRPRNVSLLYCIKY